MSDIWSKLVKISDIWSIFEVIEAGLRGCRPVCEAVEAVDASVEAVDAVEAAGGISLRSRRTLSSSRRLPRCIKIERRTQQAAANVL